MMVAAIQVMGPMGDRSDSILLTDEMVRDRKLAAVRSPNPMIGPDHPMEARLVTSSFPAQRMSTKSEMNTKNIHLFVSKKSRVTGKKNIGRMRNDESRKSVVDFFIKEKKFIVLIKEYYNRKQMPTYQEFSFKGGGLAKLNFIK